MIDAKNAQELRALLAQGNWAVLFTTTWCPQCRAFEPKFKKYEGNAPAKFARIVIDSDDNPGWDAFDVTSVPTVVLFEDGKEKARIECGAACLSEAEFRKLIGI